MGTACEGNTDAFRLVLLVCVLHVVKCPEMLLRLLSCAVWHTSPLQGTEDCVTDERCARCVVRANCSSGCGVCHWRCHDAKNHTLFAHDCVVLLMTLNTPGNENQLT